jgi:hypothetical protein
MPQLIIGLFVIALIIWLIGIVFIGIGFVTYNILAFMDKMLGSWMLFSPSWSWAIMGFAVGSLLYLIIIESPTFHNSVYKYIIMIVVVCLFIFTPIVGPYTKNINLLEIISKSYSYIVEFFENPIANTKAYVSEGADKSVSYFKLMAKIDKYEAENKQYAAKYQKSTPEKFEYTNKTGNDHIRSNHSFINVSAANMRSGPSTSHNIISVIRKNEPFQIIENGKYWSKVSFNDKVGYLSNKLID